MANKFFNKEDLDDNLDNKDDTYNFQNGIDTGNTIGTDNSNEYSDQIVVGNSKAKEEMLDRNNPIVKGILIVLGLVAVIGTLYYIFIFLTTMK